MDARDSLGVGGFDHCARTQLDVADHGLDVTCPW